MYCSGCGKEIRETDDFCSNCGMKNSSVGNESRNVSPNKTTATMPNICSGSEVYYLKHSFFDDDDKADGKNVQIRFYDDCIGLYSCKQKGGFDRKIRYNDILKITVNKHFSISSLLLGIVLLLIGLSVISVYDFDANGLLSDLFIISIPVCGLAAIFNDVNKKELTIHLSDNSTFSFLTVDKQEADNLLTRLNRTN